MKVSATLARMRTQLTGIERLVRTMGSEVETLISAYEPANIEAMQEIRTGLGDMFSYAGPLQPFLAQAYLPFAPDVWCGIDTEIGGSSATVALKTLHDFEPSRGGTRIARLSVNPIFPLVEKPRWMTIECGLDIDAIKKSKTVRFDIVSFFQIAPQNTSIIPRDVRLAIRLKMSDVSFADIFEYRIPVSTMPFEHSIHVPNWNQNAAAMDTAVSVEVILGLPLAGDYTFHMDHFACCSLKV